MNFEVKNRWSGDVQFVAKINCKKNERPEIKMGLAVRWAIKTGANLRNADLRYANLSDADLRCANLYGANLRNAKLRNAKLRNAKLRNAKLRDADLRNANLSYAKHISDRIIDGGLRSDGYRFYLTRTEPGEWRIKAGCRNFTVAVAKVHWDETRPKGESLGDETRLIIANMLAIAKLRKWSKS